MSSTRADVGQKGKELKKGNAYYVRGTAAHGTKKINVLLNGAS